MVRARLVLLGALTAAQIGAHEDGRFVRSREPALFSER
jgi:hypothetical protein